MTIMPFCRKALLFSKDMLTLKFSSHALLRPCSVLRSYLDMSGCNLARYFIRMEDVREAFAGLLRPSTPCVEPCLASGLSSLSVMIGLDLLVCKDKLVLDCMDLHGSHRDVVAAVDSKNISRSLRCPCRPKPNSWLASMR